MIDADTADVSWSEEHDAYTIRFDDESDGFSPSVAVAQALEAALDGCDGKPLFDYVDPDAFDALVVGSSGVTVSFDVESATVTVHGDGRVFVRP